MKVGICDPEPTSTERSQGITPVVVLERFFVEDGDENEDDFQEKVVQGGTRLEYGRAPPTGIRSVQAPVP